VPFPGTLNPRSLPARRNGRRRTRRGLTLLEVLLSLAILAVALGAIAQLTANGVRGSVRSRLQMQAVARCQSKLAEIVTGAEPLRPVDRRCFEDDRRWTWSLTIAPQTTSGLLLLQVSVGRVTDSRVAEISYSLNRLVRPPDDQRS
jgi:type II secretion system protein I